MAKHISIQEWHIFHAFSSRVDGALEAGLQRTLPDFQGLLKDPAPYPDLSSELPGVTLEDDDVDLQVVTDEPEPDFVELAAAALDNAGINMHTNHKTRKRGTWPDTCRGERQQNCV